MQRASSDHFSLRRVSIRLLAAMLLAAGCGDSGTLSRDASESVPVPHATAEPRRSAPLTSLNLVLVTLDTTRADALGAYGQRWPTSPQIDRLASRGVLFEQVNTSNPETLPAHASLFTGRWPFAHGVRSNAGYMLPRSERTLAEILRAHGYETAAEVSASVLRRSTQITQGFRHYRGAESKDVTLKKIRFSDGAKRTVTKPMRVGSDITAKGIEFLRRSGRAKFFLWLHYFDAHDPYYAPPAFAREIPQSPYHAEVASVDFQLGLFLAELDRLGLRERTLVVVTADHGESLGDHGEPTHSYFVYESTLRVPLILAGPPSLPVGRRIPAPVRTIDILPTTLDLLGLPVPENVQGVSLRPLIADPGRDLELTSYAEATRFLTTFGLPPLRALRKGRWKYLHKVNAELYDLDTDPSELRNLAAEKPEIVTRLRTRLEALLRSTPLAGGRGRAEVDPQRAAELVALGYADRSPGVDSGNKLDSLELSGGDPRDKIADTLPISIALGLMQRQEYQAALEKLRPVRTRNPRSTYVLDLITRALIGLGRADDAIEVLHDLLGIEPCDAGSRDALVRMLRESHDYAALRDAVADGSARCPESQTYVNNYAWALATLPDPALRDGALAEKLIRRAIASSQGSEPAYLDTLAAALAEEGLFEKAIATESELIHRLDQEGAPKELIRDLRAHVRGFRAGEAIRDPAVPAS